MIGIDDGGGMPLVSVTELRQYSYCPRVVYYMAMIPRPLTGKMREGKQSHSDEDDRERRRSLRPYGLSGGDRAYGVRIEDRALGLRGQLDMLVLTPDEAIPIEHKLSNGPLAQTHRMQLQAYGLLVAAAYALPVRRGFVYWIPRRRSTAVVFTVELEEQTRRAIQSVQGIRTSEALPPPTHVVERCTDCEFRRFCGDRPRV